MNSNGRNGENCGQINRFLAQLTQQINQDLAFQESVGTPFNSGIDQNNLMPPQSFRVDDLFGELQNEEASDDFQPFAEFAYNPQGGEFQPQLQSENFQARNEVTAQNPFLYQYDNPYEANPFSYGNLQNYPPPNFQHYPPPNFQNYPPPNFLNYPPPNIQNFPSPNFQCHVPQNVGTVIYPRIEYELPVQQQSEKSDQIEHSYETTLMDEAACKQNTEEICCPLEPMVKFNDPQKFSKYLALKVGKYRNEQRGIKNPTKERTGPPTEILLDDTIRYTHIRTNPYRNHSDPDLEGYGAKDEGDWIKAVYCFDEAVRQDNTNTESWAELSYSLVNAGKPIRALIAIKELLRLDPGSLRGNWIASDIYKRFDCDYQACQSIFNWFKYNEKYNFLIPEDFEMNGHSEKTELESHQFQAVLRLFCMAAQQNRTGNIDVLLQDSIAELVGIKEDFQKKVDCLQTILRANPTQVGKFLDLGVALFQNGEPYKALEAYRSAFEGFKCRNKDPDTEININKACLGLGLTQFYLENYREAINWFIRALEKDYDFEMEESGCSYESEYDLCLRLYLQVTDIVN